MFKPGLFRRIFALILLIGVACAVSGCGVPSPDISTAAGKAQILDDVNQFLDIGDCSDALTEISPLYNSAYTDNTVRMAMASVYACSAGFNFFDFINKATSANVSSLSFLFEFMAQEFPSTGPVGNPGDKVVEAAGYGIDALMSVLNPGEVLVTTDLINTGTNNEGSLLYTDRTSDSNAYMFFLSMAAMGGEENRLGANATTGAPDAAAELPWTTYDYSGTGTLATDGCTYASSLLNFADTIKSVSETSNNGCGTQPSATDVLAYVAWGLNCLANTGAGTSFSQLIYDACMYGCQNVKAQSLGTQEGTFMSFNGNWAAPCNANLGCSSCSLLLRDRNNCTGAANDEASCSAAGIINFVNNSAIGWQ